MQMIVRRAAAAVPVMGVVAVVAFVLMYVVPVDPAALIAGEFATGEDIARLRAVMGLDEPLGRQFVAWLGRLARGDLGTSIFTHLPVTELIVQRLEPTLSIAALTLLLTLVVALPLGALAACFAGGWIDRFATGFVVLALSAPVFLVGYLLVHAFAIRLPWFPVQGYAPLAKGVAAWSTSLALPCLNLAIVYAALLTRITRATVLDTLREDYIRTARAIGLGTFAVLRHALRNAAIPIAATIGTSVAALLGGVVIVESVFGLPGIGRLVVDSLLRRDYPVVQGVLLLAAAANVLVGLLVDLSYPLFDPRLRNGGR